MKTIIRQEWKARNKTILTISGLISLVSLSIILSGTAQNLFKANTSLLTYWFSLAFFGIYLGAPIYALTLVISSINSMVFKDTKYLLLSLPKSSWKLIGGKFLIMLSELVIYFLIMFFWISIFYASSQGNFLTINEIIINTKTTNFWNALTSFYSFIFIKHCIESLQVVFFALIFATFIMLVFGFSATLFASIFRHKQIPKILSFIFVYISFDSTARLMASIFKNTNFNSVSSLWPPVLVIAIISALLYSGICLLFEKRIEG